MPNAKSTIFFIYSLVMSKFLYIRELFTVEIISNTVTEMFSPHIIKPLHSYLFVLQTIEVNRLSFV